MSGDATSPTVAIIGAGPAGLMAADVLSRSGCHVCIFEAMPSAGRKLLRAGIGGLNLTHAEPYATFLNRYGAQQPQLRPMLDAFGPQAVRNWAKTLGIETFTGSSGRVFPADMKAAPLLRAWLRRLHQQGVKIHTRHRWLGWHEEGTLRIQSPEGAQRIQPTATLLALGGGSWPQLGSDAAWVSILKARNLPVTPLQPANCGFEVLQWSEHLKNQWAGSPLKGVALHVAGQPVKKGECVLTEHGLEGSLIYAHAAWIREQISQYGVARIGLDLLPDRSLEQILAALKRPQARQSLSNHLKRQLLLDRPKIALMYEATDSAIRQDPQRLAHALKCMPIELVRPRPLSEAISTAGGLSFDALDEHLMVRQQPGLFCAGEMLDWEAPTGGYLLTACLATGAWAAQGLLAWLSESAK